MQGYGMTNPVGVEEKTVRMGSARKDAVDKLKDDQEGRIYN